MPKKKIVKKLPVEVVLIANNDTEYKGAGETFEEAIRAVVAPEMFVTAVDIRVFKDGQVIAQAQVRGSRVWKLYNGDDEVKEIVLGQLKILLGL